MEQKKDIHEEDASPVAKDKGLVGMGIPDSFDYFSGKEYNDIESARWATQNLNGRLRSILDQARSYQPKTGNRMNADELKKEVEAYKSVVAEKVAMGGSVTKAAFRRAGEEGFRLLKEYRDEFGRGRAPGMDELIAGLQTMLAEKEEETDSAE